MKTLLALVLLLSAFRPLTVTASSNGDQKYTPTALEWLHMVCMSHSTRDPGFFSTCLMEKPDTIVVSIGWWDEFKKKKAEDEFIPINFLVKDEAKAKGWDWLKVVKKVEHIKPPQ